MMYDYIVLSGCMTVFGVMLAYSLVGSRGLHRRSVIVTLGVLLGLTAVFDSMIILSGIVGYDYDKTLGIVIGAAPIEDFLYTIVVVPLTIALWRFYEEK
jgi:lycopene cyclase domain-containing protein